MVTPGTRKVLNAIDIRRKNTEKKNTFLNDASRFQTKPISNRNRFFNNWKRMNPNTVSADVKQLVNQTFEDLELG